MNSVIIKIILLLIVAGLIYLIIYLSCGDKDKYVDKLSEDPATNACQATCMAVFKAGEVACDVEGLFEPLCELALQGLEDICDSICEAPECTTDDDCTSQLDTFKNYYTTCTEDGGDGVKRCKRTYTQAECDTAAKTNENGGIVSTGFGNICEPAIGTVFDEKTGSCACKPNGTCSEAWNKVATKCVANTSQYCRSYYMVNGSWPKGCPQEAAAACIANKDYYWCHVNNSCVKHGEGDACPTSDQCVSSDGGTNSSCRCNDPGDPYCFPENVCLQQPDKYWCYNDATCYNHGEGDACPGVENCVSSEGGSSSPSCIYSSTKDPSIPSMLTESTRGFCCNKATVDYSWIIAEDHIATCCDSHYTEQTPWNIGWPSSSSPWTGCVNQCQTAGGGPQ